MRPQATGKVPELEVTMCSRCNARRAMNDSKNKLCRPCSDSVRYVDSLPYMPGPTPFSRLSSAEGIAMAMRDYEG